MLISKLETRAAPREVAATEYVVVDGIRDSVTSAVDSGRQDGSGSELGGPVRCPQSMRGKGVTMRRLRAPYASRVSSTDRCSIEGYPFGVPRCSDALTVAILVRIQIVPSRRFCR